MSDCLLASVYNIACDLIKLLGLNIFVGEGVVSYYYSYLASYMLGMLLALLVGLISVSLSSLRLHDAQIGPIIITMMLNYLC